MTTKISVLLYTWVDSKLADALYNLTSGAGWVRGGGAFPRNTMLNLLLKFKKWGWVIHSIWWLLISFFSASRHSRSRFSELSQNLYLILKLNLFTGSMVYYKDKNNLENSFKNPKIYLARKVSVLSPCPLLRSHNAGQQKNVLTNPISQRWTISWEKGNYGSCNVTNQISLPLVS